MTRAKTTAITPAQHGKSAHAAPVVKNSPGLQPRPAAKKSPAHQSPPVASASDVVAPVAARSKPAEKKEKRLRVSHRMTATQSALLDQLKSRSLRLGHAAKKGDVIFAGLQLLNKLTEKAFEAAILPLLATPKFKKNAARKNAAKQPKA